jgi:hypothetical protein
MQIIKIPQEGADFSSAAFSSKSENSPARQSRLSIADKLPLHLILTAHVDNRHLAVAKLTA